MEEKSIKRLPPLHRNQACAACKRKKRKCDAVKPVCSACINSSKLYQEPIQCEYPADKPEPAREKPYSPTASTSKRGRTYEPIQNEHEISVLQARVAELEKQLIVAQDSRVVIPQGWPVTPPGTSSSRSQKSTDAISPDIPQTAGDILHSAWPKSLPQLNLVKMLVQTALSMLSNTIIFPPEQLFHSLALAPQDPRFPSTALLHALCSLGATMCPMPVGTIAYWEPEASPSAYHFTCAKKSLQTFKLNQVLDDVRAALLLAIYSFTTRDFLEVWQIVGLACRALPPAGLNHLQLQTALPSNKMAVAPGLFLRKPTFLSQPLDDYETFYRAATMWQIFSCDVWMGACSGWSTAMALDGITSFLPVWPSDTAPLDVVLNQSAIDPHAQTFLTTHLLSPVISLHLSIKAMILLGKIVTFLQQSTLPGVIASLKVKQEIRHAPSFLGLRNMIVEFQRFLPQQEQNPLRQTPDGRLDANLIGAHVVPSVALLLLYEPFVYGDDQDDAFQLSLAAADSILRITEQIYAHSRDEISFYYTQINYCWMVCSRTLIRAMRFREAAGDAHAASIYRQQVEFLLARVTPLSTRSPLVASCLTMIQNLIKDESSWYTC